MKKSIVALAVMGTVGASAFAQSSVQIVGTADAFIGSMRAAGDAKSTMLVGSGGMTTSYFGFKGGEDLGGGLKANFALTSFFQMNNGSQGRFGGDTMFSRDANVGLSGSFGSFTVGRGLAPNFLPTVIFNPFGDSFTFSPLVLHANVPLFNGTGWSATTPADTGWSGEVIYSTPNFSGLSANLHYQMPGSSALSGKSNTVLNVLYFGGPLALTAFYESAQLTNPVVAAQTGNDKKTDWMVGGSYDFGAAKAYLTTGSAKSQVTALTTKTNSLGASIPVGAGKIEAGYANTKVSGGGNTRSTLTVGYDYSLSKLTDVYFMVMNDRITTFSSGTSVGLGIRKNF